MGMETLPISEQEAFKIRQTIQAELIKRAGNLDDRDRTEHAMDWIAMYAEKFDRVFERRMDEPDFMERCKTDLGNVVKEVELELFLEEKTDGGKGYSLAA